MFFLPTYHHNIGSAVVSADSAAPLSWRSNHWSCCGGSSPVPERYTQTRQDIQFSNNISHLTLVLNGLPSHAHLIENIIHRNCHRTSCSIKECLHCSSAPNLHHLHDEFMFGRRISSSIRSFASLRVRNIHPLVAVLTVRRTILTRRMLHLGVHFIVRAPHRTSAARQ